MFDLVTKSMIEFQAAGNLLSAELTRFRLNLRHGPAHYGKAVTVTGPKLMSAM